MAPARSESTAGVSQSNSSSLGSRCLTPPATWVGQRRVFECAERALPRDRWVTGIRRMVTGRGSHFLAVRGGSHGHGGGGLLRLAVGARVCGWRGRQVTAVIGTVAEC